MLPRATSMAASVALCAGPTALRSPLGSPRHVRQHFSRRARCCACMPAPSPRLSPLMVVVVVAAVWVLCAAVVPCTARARRSEGAATQFTTDFKRGEHGFCLGGWVVVPQTPVREGGEPPLRDCKR